MAFDLGDVLKEAQKIDKHFDKWLKESYNLTENFRNAFFQGAKGDYSGINSILKKFQELQKAATNSDESILKKSGVKNAEKLNTELDKMIGYMRALVAMPRDTAFSPEQILKSVRSIAELKDEISQLKGKIKENQELFSIATTKKDKKYVIDESKRLNDLLKNAKAELNIAEMTQSQLLWIVRKGTSDILAEEERKNSKKKREDERAARDSIRAAKKAEKDYRESYAGSLEYSKNAKSLVEMQIAIKSLTAARAKENLKTKDGQMRYQELTAEIERMNKKYAEVTETVNKSHQRMSGIAGQLARKLALVFSVSQIQGYINKIADVRGEFELQQRSLQAILQNKTETNELWQKTTELAVRSPFRVGQLTSYVKQLAAYRIESDRLYDTNKRLADISAGLGVDMQRLILAYGQVRSAEYLRGTELRQFTEAGIPMLDMLAKHLSIVHGKALSVADVFEMISKRMVTFSDVEAVIMKMTDEGGTFYNMQEIQADTLKGMISNLKDSVDLMMNEIGKANDGMMKWGVNATKALVDNWQIVANVLKTSAVAFALVGANALASAHKLKVWARYLGIFVPVGQKSVGILKMMQISFRMLGVTIEKTAKSMAAFVKGNWVTLLVTVALAAVVKLTKAWFDYRKEIKEINKEQARLSDSMNKIAFNFDQAKLKDDTNAAKEELQRLIDLAENEYNIKFKIDVADLSAEEAQNKFNEIYNNMQEAASIATTLQGAQVNKVFDDIGKNFADAGNSGETALNNLRSALISIKGAINNTVRDDEGLINTLNRFQKALIKDSDILNQKSFENTTQYYERLRKLLYGVTNDYLAYNDAMSTAGAGAQQLGKKMVEVQNSLKGIGVDTNMLLPLSPLFDDYNKDMNILKLQLGNFISVIDTYTKDLPKDKKELVFQILFSKMGQKYEWGEFSNELSKDFAEKEYNIILTPETPKPKELKQWQKDYNKLIEGNDAGFMAITEENAETTKRNKLLQEANDKYEAQKKLIDEITNARQVGSNLYDDKDLKEEQSTLAYIDKVRKMLGGGDKDKKKREKDEKKSLQTRIKLIEDMYNAYNEANKLMSKPASVEQVNKSFKDTFKEVFEGTGIDFSTLMIDKKKLTDLQKAGEESGKVFSDAMLAEMAKMAEGETYLRDYNDAFIEHIKERESVILKAKNVEKEGNTPKYTIGYGEYNVWADTGKKITAEDTITEEEAYRRLTEILLPKYRKELNAILDRNKELIFTQEQYNELLDLAFQGGSGKVTKLFSLANDVDSGAEHIQDIYKKVKETFGEDDAERFGDAFLTKFKEAETVYDRIALLLQTMNLETANGINKDLYKGMQTRSDLRSAMFSGDLEAIKLLQKAAIDVSQIDFTNIEGVVALLKKLRPMAKKESKEALLKLDKEISKWEAKIGLNVREEDKNKLFEDIQNMFDNFDLAKSMKKEGMSDDLMYTLFGVENIGLDKLRDRIVDKFKKTAGDAADEFALELDNRFDDIDWAAVSNLIGKDEAEELRKSLAKIGDMERKQYEENAQEYIKYAKMAVSERAKIKLDELKKIKKIEETFKEQEGDSEETKATKANLRKDAIANVQKEAKAAMNKLDWEEFQRSDTFTNLFRDLDSASSALLDHTLAKLKEFKEQWRGMQLEDIKQLVTKIEELEIQLAKIKPFSAYRDAREMVEQGMNSVTFQSETAQKTAAKGGQGNFFQALEEENVFQEERLKNATEEATIIEAILRTRQGMATEEEGMLANTAAAAKYNEYTNQQLDNELKSQRGIEESAKNTLTANNTLLSKRQQQIVAFKAQADAIGQAATMAADLYGTFKELTEVLVDDDPAMVFADMGMNILQSIPQMLSLIAQIQAATLAAEGLGTAMNMAMGVIGLIVMGVQLITQAISAIFKFKDQKLQNQIDEQLKKVENLRDKYEDLKEAMDKAYDIGQMEQYQAEMDKTIEQAIKAQEAAIAAQQQRKDTKENREKLENMRKDLEELRKEQEEAWKDSFSKVTDGILDDVQGVARGFVDAWLDAFLETGSGMKGLKDNFKDMFKNILKQQASLSVMKPYMDRMTSYLQGVINENDLEFSKEDALGFKKLWDEIIPMMDESIYNYLEPFLDYFKEDNYELSALTKGIQGMTEAQAEVLTAYWNSVRAYTASIDEKLSVIVANYSSAEDNPILTQLRQQTSFLNRIHDMIDSTMRGGTYGFNVRLIS